MKLTRNHTIGLLLAAALPVLMTACGESNASDTKEATSLSGTSTVVNVKVEEIQPADFSETVRITGSVEAYDDVLVPAEEGGRVMEWTAQKGARVSKGQVIARIDDALLKAGFDAANAQYQLAEVTYTKQKSVYQEQAISEWQLKSYEYQRDAARAQADMAKARLEKSRIKSPIDGVLDARMVDAGEMIGAGAPVARVVNTARLKVAAGVPERYAASFKVGDPVSFTVDALPGRTFSGKVTVVGAAVNRDNRTIPVEVQVSNGSGVLKPDMIAALTITLASKPGSIVISEDYIQQIDRGVFVAFVEKNGSAEERKIEIGATSGGMVLVTRGLSAGDRLITLGHQNVASGQAIKVID